MFEGSAGNDFAYYANLASFAGLLVGVVGGVASVAAAIKARGAERAAEGAAEETRLAIRRLDIVADFSAVLTVLEELKQYHRAEEWNIALQRYGSVTTRLVAIKNKTPGLTTAQQAVIQNSIQQIGGLENRVELIFKGAKPEPAKLNRVLVTQVTDLSELMFELTSDMEKNSYGGR